jgi:hypothetical protein
MHKEFKSNEIRIWFESCYQLMWEAHALMSWKVYKNSYLYDAAFGTPHVKYALYIKMSLYKLNLSFQKMFIIWHAAYLFRRDLS